MVPDRNPRTECACQPVVFISSFAVTPPGRLSSSRTWLVLLLARAGFTFLAPLGAFLAWVAFFANFPFFGATLAPRAARPAFLAAFGFSPAAGAGLLVSSVIDVFM